MANTQEIALGPARVLFTGVLGGITHTDLDLGAFSSDGVTITLSTDLTEISTDQSGTKPAKQFLGGQDATITTPMLQENFDNFFISQIGAVSGTGNSITGGRIAGFDVSNNWSGSLKVIPVDTTRDQFEFYNVTPNGDRALQYNTTDATLLNVEWRALPDFSRTDGDLLFSRTSQP